MPILPIKLARRHCVISRDGISRRIVHEEGRESIRVWRDSRRRGAHKKRKCFGFWLHFFNVDTVRHFLLNFNFMVLIQLVAALISVFIFQVYNIAFEIHLILLVSPIVFPLAFSIVTDFQRREKVLEDLALFKTSTMMWYFCMREWQKGAGKDSEWLDAVHAKLKSLLFYLHEFLLTEDTERRNIIVRVLYEDFSDCSQLTDEIRQSDLPSNTAIVSRAICLVGETCLSFERLRVVREYRSPRSIRAFNKVFVMLFPIIIAPHFIFKAREDMCGMPQGHSWKPYYITVIVTVVFSILQGVQDKLDDPFDGLSEDDINLEALEEWTSHYMKHTKARRFDVKRYRKNKPRFQDMSLKESSDSITEEPGDEDEEAKPSVKKGLKAAMKQLAFASLSFDNGKGSSKDDPEKGQSIGSGLMNAAAKSIFFATLAPIDTVGGGGGFSDVASCDGVGGLALGEGWGDAGVPEQKKSDDDGDEDADIDMEGVEENGTKEAKIENDEEEYEDEILKYLQTSEESCHVVNSDDNKGGLQRQDTTLSDVIAMNVQETVEKGEEIDTAFPLDGGSELWTNELKKSFFVNDNDVVVELT